MSLHAYDVVVIGGGLAGLSAALRAAGHGARVAVLEKGEEERYPCNSRVAMGFFTVAGQDSRAGPERLNAAIAAVTGGEADPALAARLAEDSGPALRWIMEQGVRFIQFGAPPNRRPVLVPLVPLRPGLNAEGRGAEVMMRRLEARLAAAGGRILRGHSAEALLMADRRCAGVVARRRGEAIRFEARAVVIADGGFQADLDLVGSHISPRPEGLLQRNTGSGRGDGLRMAVEVGAMPVGLGAFYGHVQSRAAMRDRRLWPYPTLDLPASHGIVVNGNGDRFADEGLGGIFLANAIARQEDPLGTFAIFDQAIWEGPASTFVVPPNPHLASYPGALLRAETPEALAVAAGLPPDRLAAAVRSYNQAIASGRTADLEPARTAAAFRPMPVATPPFYAAPLCAGITYTMGGIAIEGESRVRHRDGGTIPGLYAAGSTTGGHEGGSRAGYTGGLMKALVFGLRAADHIGRTLGAGPSAPAMPQHREEATQALADIRPEEK